MFGINVVFMSVNAGWCVYNLLEMKAELYRGARRAEEGVSNSGRNFRLRSHIVCKSSEYARGNVFNLNYV